MSDQSGLRVSDADRDQAATDLRDHYAAGRITSDELSERLDRVYAAQTTAELDDLRTDLPDLRPVRRSDPRRLLARRRLYQDAGGMVILDVGCVGVWAASGAHGGFWPVWVILVSALRIGRDGWRLFGPAGELETPATDPAGAAANPDDHRRLRRELHDARHAARAARRRR
jgi:hypothetical protein